LTLLRNVLGAALDVCIWEDTSMTDWTIDNRSTALRAIFDTVVPSIQRVDDPTGFWARKSTGIVTD
jgi:hypothetical protein